MSTLLKNRIDQLSKEFDSFESWEDKYKHIISRGKELAPLDEQYRVDSNKVKGCQSQVWLHASLQEDKCIRFQADSDASIVKGIIAILLSVYDKASPSEVLSTSPDFLDQIGLKQHLSMSRANGLNAMVKQIHFYAMAFQAKLSMANA